jgi:beta-lactamase regulating signal transducer with metallopeptidase domain
MIGFAVCLDADVLIPRSVELGVQTLGVTLVHGTLLAALTWLVTRLKFFRVRPALSFALWALVLLKFFMPSGPALVKYAPSELLARAVTAASSSEDWARELWAGLLLHPRTLIGLALLLTYGLIVAVLLRRWLHSQWALSRATRALQPLTGAPRELLMRCATQLGVRPPDARITDEPWTPMVVGCLRPIVVLPAWLLREPELLESVLLHELGHIRRRDPWSHQVQRLAEAVFFFWPVVHWVTARLRESREMACDALVLSHGHVSPHDYGCALLRIARHARCAPQPAMLGAASCGRRTLERRIDYLLAPHPRERFSLPAIAGITAWGLFVLSGASPPPAPDPAGLFDASACRNRIETDRGWLVQRRPLELIGRLPAPLPRHLPLPLPLIEQQLGRPPELPPAPERTVAKRRVERPRPARSPSGCRRAITIQAAIITPRGTSATPT